MAEMQDFFSLGFVKTLWTGNKKLVRLQTEGKNILKTCTKRHNTEKSMHR